jgi:hypothetical protein
MADLIQDSVRLLAAALFLILFTFLIIFLLFIPKAFA